MVRSRSGWFVVLIGALGSLLLSGAAWAQEVAAPAAEIANGFIDRHFDVIVLVVGAIFSFVFGIPIVKKFLKDKLGISPEAYALVKSAAVETWHGYVRKIKEGRADGKLTKAEKAEARRLTTEAALTKAKEVGVPLLKAVIPSLLEKAVNALKKDAVAAKGISGKDIKPAEAESDVG